MMNVKNEEITNVLIERINNVYKESVGFETYGDTTEFYDEDGVVLMSVTEEGNKLIFDFGYAENLEVIKED